MKRVEFPRPTHFKCNGCHLTLKCHQSPRQEGHCRPCVATWKKPGFLDKNPLKQGSVVVKKSQWGPQYYLQIVCPPCFNTLRARFLQLLLFVGVPVDTRRRCFVGKHTFVVTASQMAKAEAHAKKYPNGGNADLLYPILVQHDPHCEAPKCANVIVLSD